MTYSTILSRVPVVINDCYGDPLYPLQFEDSLRKLESLRGRAGTTAMITKGTIDDYSLRRLSSVWSENNVVIYSLTGLDEGEISLAERIRTLDLLLSVTRKIVILFRPIIAGQNDQERTIDNIVAVAASRTLPLVFGGLKIRGTDKRKILSERVRNRLLRSAITRSLKVFSKSACAVAYLNSRPCDFHTSHETPNEDGVSLVRDLGYSLLREGNSIALESGTIGDSNFIRFIARAMPTVSSLLPGSNILSISSPDNIYEATSSYFVWSRNISNCYGCDYCCIRDIEHLKGASASLSIGCNPSDLLNRISHKGLG